VWKRGEGDLDAHIAAVVFNHDGTPGGDVLEAEHAATARQKMASVVEGVEAQEVGVEQGAKNVLALGEGAEDLRGGEGGMEEQPTADLLQGDITFA
jgi:hypothetical protein